MTSLILENGHSQEQTHGNALENLASMERGSKNW
jgi:hypothetical protein